MGQGISVGVGASYRVTWDPCGTRLTLWEAQMGEPLNVTVPPCHSGTLRPHTDPM